MAFVTLDEDSLAALEYAKNNNCEGFIGIVAKYENRLLNTIRNKFNNMPNGFSHEDIIQDTYLTILDGKFTSYKGKSKIISWLTRIAVNKGTDRVRKERARGLGKTTSIDSETSGGLLVQIPESPQQQKEVENNELKIKIRHCLSGKEWEFIYKYYYLGWSIRELARYMANNESTTRVKIFRLRKKLKPFLQEFKLELV